jgi:hypothetical protein
MIQNRFNGFRRYPFRKEEPLKRLMQILVALYTRLKPCVNESDRAFNASSIRSPAAAD